MPLRKRRLECLRFISRTTFLFLYVYTYTMRLYVYCADVSTHIPVSILHISALDMVACCALPSSIPRSPPRSNEKRNAGENKMNTTAKYDTPISVFPYSLDVCLCLFVCMSACLCLNLCLCLSQCLYAREYISMGI